MKPSETTALIRPLSKGLGIFDQAVGSDAIASLGWNLLRENVSLPTAVLYEEKLAHNLQWMQKFADEYEAKLAPHGKTTMAPKLFTRQMQAGACGITLATAPQTRVAYEHGVHRVLMANQLVGRQNMVIISRLLEDPQFEFFCLVDSVDNVESLGHFFHDRGQRLNVLIEVGVKGGRTGFRDREQLRNILAALSSWRDHVALCGVEVYEGVLNDETFVRELLQHAVSVTRELAEQKHFNRTPIILSGAGSAWYNVVADVFCAAKTDEPLEVILRPGCYVTHDVGVYRDAQQKIKARNPVAKRMNSSLVPALQVWAYVQSVPEKNKAIVALGKRDAAFDAGLPVPALHYRPGTQEPIVAPSGWRLTKMMDQHAYLDTGEGCDILVGDMIGFDISHPCLTFDRWRYLLVVDERYQVIDVVETFF